MTSVSEQRGEKTIGLLCRSRTTTQFVTLLVAIERHRSLEVGDERSNCQTRKMTAFLFTFYLAAFPGTHPRKKGLEELDNM